MGKANALITLKRKGNFSLQQKKRYVRNRSEYRLGVMRT